LADEHHIFELWEDTRPAGDDSTDAHKTVQVRLAQLAEGVNNGKVSDPDMNFIVDIVVLRVVEQGNIQSNLVKNLENFCGLVGKEVPKNSLCAAQVCI
jgi:hypothetical protein